MEDNVRAVGVRPDGVNRKKLTDMEDKKKVSIYHKASGGSINTQLTTGFLREALTIFSKSAAEYFAKARTQGNTENLYQIVGGDAGSFKMILDWIQDCVDQQAITKFPDIPEPEAEPFGPTLKVIEAADILDIPAGSLQWFLKKRLENIARKHLMPFPQIREFYNPTSDLYKAGLQSVACSSVFNAWWDYRLDGKANVELLQELSDLRAEFPELDEDLHQACKDKEEEVKHRKLAKQARNRDGEDAGTSEYNVDGQAWPDNGRGQEGDQSSAWDASSTVDTKKENINISADHAAWEQPIMPKNGANGGANMDTNWADEVAATDQIKSESTDIPLPARGW